MRGPPKRRRGFAFALAVLCLAGLAPVPTQAYLDAAAAYRMGLRFHHPLDGQGRPNYAVALMLYCRADAEDYAPAAFGIGLLYAAGKGVPRSDRRAAAWFRRAAELGYEDAKGMLSLYKGRGVPRCPNGWGRGGNPAAQLAAAPAKVRALIRKLAPTFGLDPGLVLAVVAVESAFRSNAVSSANAQGLMQLIPETADRFGVRDPFDPEQNLRGGMAYLKWLLRRFDGKLPLALAAYNAGENAVARYKGIPPYRETQRYVRKVRRLYQADRAP